MRCLIVTLMVCAVCHATPVGQSATTPGPGADRGGCADRGRLWRAVCLVESGGDPRALNPAENAVGIAQIRPIVIRDLRRLGYKFTLRDRSDPAASRRIFRAYTAHYMRRYRLAGPEAAARIWVSGPRGWDKPASLPYWRKVRQAMREQQEEK